jgi:hypothetical protein
VKIFWLAFTVTMALASFWTRRFYDWAQLPSMLSVSY